MKKPLIILALITIIFSCSKGDDDASTTLQFDSSALEATGDLSEQSAKEAKKTIYGKWNFPSSSSARSACKLVSLEFTGQNYFMTLDTGDKGTMSGKFTLGEDASGKVEKVELKHISDDNSEIVLAVLTNMVVTKTGDDLNATFNLVLKFPTASSESSTVSFSSCNDALSGNIEAKKAEPMAESKNASADSNHAKFIGTWQIASVGDSKNFTLEDFYRMECQDDGYDPDTGEKTTVLKEDCIIPSKMGVAVSPYGTYNTLSFDANGSVLESVTGTWKWKDSSQKEFTTTEDGDSYGEIDSYTITSISASEMTIQDEDGLMTMKKVQ